MPKSKDTSTDNPRRSFLKNLSCGITGGLLASGTITERGWASPVIQNEASLKIVKVEPHLLTGVRGYGPWLFVRVETQEGIVGWGEGTNFPRRPTDRGRRPQSQQRGCRRERLGYREALEQDVPLPLLQWHGRCGAGCYQRHRHSAL